MGLACSRFAVSPDIPTLGKQNGHVVNVLKGSTGSSKNIFEQIRRISTLLARPSSKISNSTKMDSQLKRTSVEHRIMHIADISDTSDPFSDAPPATPSPPSSPDSLDKFIHYLKEDNKSLSRLSMSRSRRSSLSRISPALGSDEDILKIRDNPFRKRRRSSQTPRYVAINEAIRESATRELETISNSESIIYPPIPPNYCY